MEKIKFHKEPFRKNVMEMINFLNRVEELALRDYDIAYDEQSEKDAEICRALYEYTYKTSQEINIEVIRIMKCNNETFVGRMHDLRESFADRLAYLNICLEENKSKLDLINKELDLLKQPH
jgi:hypothetical protein